MTFPAALVGALVAWVVRLPVAVELPLTTAMLVTVLGPPGTGVFVSTRISVALVVGLAVMVVLAKLGVQAVVEEMTGREVEMEWESVMFDIVLELVLDLLLVGSGLMR